MYIIISLIFIIICITFLSLKKIEIFRSRYKQQISFFLTIIATFIGVFVAIAFNNYNQNNIEIEKTIKLLEVSGYELSQIKMESEIAQSIIDADSTIKAHDFLKKNYLSKPDIFENIMGNQLFIRNVSLQSFQALSRVNKNIQKLYFWIQSNNKTIKKQYIPQTLSNSIFYTQKIIDAEISYLNEEINSKELEHLNQKYIYELLSNFDSKFNKEKK